MKPKHPANRLAFPTALTLAGLVLVTAQSAQAAGGTWTQSVAGTYNWSDTTAWSGGVVANGAGSNAAFNNIGGGNIITTLDSARTIGGLSRGGTGTSTQANWTITSATNALTFDNGTSNVGISFGANAISILTVDTDLVLNSNLVLSANGNANNQIVLGASVGSHSITGSGNITFSNNTSFGAGKLTINDNINTTGGIINNSLQSSQPLSIAGNIGSTVTGVTQNGTVGLTLTGANTYTGTTSVTGGTLTVSGTIGTINASSTVTVSGGLLSLDNGLGSVNRLKDTATITFGGNTGGGNLSFTGNGATSSTTETIGGLAIDKGASTITLTGAGAGQLQTISVGSTGFSRANNATLLVRGTSLQTAATNATRLLINGASGTGLTLVGAGTAAVGTSTAGTTKTLSIVPYFLGDTSASGNGSSFLTYDTSAGTGGGLRPLAAGEYATLGAGYTTAATVENAKAFNGTISTASDVTVNSLLFSTASQTLNGSGGKLIVNSGAVAATTNNEVIGSGFSRLTLGNGTWNEGIITASSGNTLTINTPIDVTGSGGLTKSGAGTLVLSASNLFSGQTTVNQGTLQIGTGTTGDLGSNTANIVLNGGTLSFGRTNTGLTLSNNISGIGGLTQNGTGGRTVLSGTNSYTGATTVTAGTLVLSSANSITGATSVAAAGILQLGSATSMGSSTTTLASGATLQLRNDANTTFTVPIATPGSGVGVTYNFDVNQAASGTGKTLTLGNLTFASSTANTINVTGGNSYSLGLGTISAPSGTGSAWAFTINATTAAVAITKFSAGSFGSALQLQGGNTITLNGFEFGSNASNSLTVSGSTTVVNLGAASATNARSTGGAAYTLTDGTLNLTNTKSLANVNVSGTAITPTFTITAGTLNNTSGSALSLAANSGTTAGSPNTTINGDFAFGTSLSTSANDLNLGIGTVSLGTTTGTTRQVTVNGATTLTLGGIISDGTTANSLTKAGTGTLALSGASTFTGTTNVSGGMLIIGHASALGTTAGNTVVSSGAEVFLGTASLAVAEPLNIAGNGTSSGNGAIHFGGGVSGMSISGAVTLSGAATIKTDGSAGSTLSGGIDLGSNILTFALDGGAASTISTNAIIGTGSVVKTGLGTLNVNVANSYTGSTTISAGKLSASNIVVSGGSSNLGNATSSVTLGSSGAQGTLSYTGSSDTYTRGFTIGGSGGGRLDVTTSGQTLTIATGAVTGSGTFTVGGAGDTSISANLTHSGGLIKTDSGTLTISGTGNTFTGNTDVNQGKLVINGYISTSALTTVSSGATLGGSGTVGALTISTGGFVTPGNSPGILTVNGDYTQAGQYSAELAGTTAGADYDQIDVAGNVDITGGTLVAMFSGSYSENDLLFILQNDGTDAITGIYTGFSQGDVVANYGGFDWIISYHADSTTNTFSGAPNGNDIALMAVPEPGVAALLGGLGLLALGRRRRCER